MSSQKSLHFPVLRSHSWFECGSVIVGTLFTRELRKKKNKKRKYVLVFSLHMFPGGNTKSVRPLHSVMILSLMSVYQTLDATSISRDL